MTTHIKDFRMSTNEEKFESYVEYLKNYDYYFNPFEALNMGENSISQLLAWLLDVYWIYEPIFKNELSDNKSIHYNFCLNFFKLIKAQEKEQRQETFLQKLSEGQLNELAKNMHSEQDTNNIDILLISKYTKDGKEKGFVCVIENKKRAKLSNSIVEKNKERILQIEKYQKYINDNYNGYDTKFIYLCAEKNDINKTIAESIVDIGKVPDYLKEQLKFNDSTYNEFSEKTVAWALAKMNYTILEHSYIVLILYNILQEIKNDSFKNKILKPVEQDKMFKLIAQLAKLYNARNSKDFANKISSNSYTYKDEIVIKYNKRLKEDSDNFFRYAKDIKNKTNDKLIIKSNSKMYFYYKFSNFDYKDRIELLCRYVEYWELHAGIDTLSDNLDGYTKIVDGEYIWNICKELSKDSNLWENLKGKYNDNITKSHTLKKLIENIDNDNAKQTTS